MTIPANKKGSLLGKVIFADTTKTADIYFFKREKANIVTPPYPGVMQIVEREIGIQGGFGHHFLLPKVPFEGPCDIGFMGKVSTGTADVSVEFEVLLIDV